ncbi:KTSC domain-containing protein [Qipengyuania sp. MTN3-11]|uniref:KTSC domain-containing protein n=1 Tax=Qipengyuania sp. MTN3-11 TaxID=3056557 RepID=UPI0036F21F88
MHYFNSTAINAARYEMATGNLTIWFTSSGQGYDYPGVPSYIWNGLLSAASAGTYFNLHIRDQYAA